MRRLTGASQDAREDDAGDVAARPAADSGAHHLAPAVHRPPIETGHGTGAAVRQFQLSNAKRYVPVEGEIARTYRPLRQEV